MRLGIFVQISQMGHSVEKAMKFARAMHVLAEHARAPNCLLIHFALWAMIAPWTHVAMHPSVQIYQLFVALQEIQQVAMCHPQMDSFQVLLDLFAQTNPKALFAEKGTKYVLPVLALVEFAKAPNWLLIHFAL